MNTEELERLLGKYYKGESSIAEERTLRAFFSGDNIPEGYEAEKEIFGYYLDSVEVPEPSSDLDARIMAGIDKSELSASSGKFRKLIYPLISAAAVLLIITGSYFFFIHNSEPIDTFSDPQLAYNETMKILMNVSVRLNDGARALEPVSMISEMPAKSLQPINKSSKTIEKNLKSLGYLNAAIDITDIKGENKKIK